MSCHRLVYMRSALWPPVRLTLAFAFAVIWTHGAAASDLVAPALPVRAAAPASPASSSSSGTLSGWGNDVTVDRAFYPQDGVAQAKGRLWNLTQEVIHLCEDSGAPTYMFLIFDEDGRMVRQDGPTPPPTTGCFTLQPGDVFEHERAMPLQYQMSATGDPDGTPLPPGFYRIEMAWLVRGPLRAPISIPALGLRPVAATVIRIE